MSPDLFMLNILIHKIWKIWKGEKIWKKIGISEPGEKYILTYANKKTCSRKNQLC